MYPGVKNAMRRLKKEGCRPIVIKDWRVYKSCWRSTLCDDHN